MIYLDNGTTTSYEPGAVIQAVADTMRYMDNSGRESRKASLGAVRTICDTRVLMLDLFNLGNPCRAAFTADSTVSLDMAIRGLFSSNDHVITTMMEHNFIFRPLYMMREKGVELATVRAGGRENVRCGDPGKTIGPSTEGIVCIHTSDLTGNIMDTEQVGRICARASLLFVLGASQTTGIFSIHVEHMGIDVLYLTDHKGLMGPQGTRGTYLREGVAVRPLMTGGSGTHSYQELHPRKIPEALEADTVSGHGVTGFHATLEFVQSAGMETIRYRGLTLMKRFYEGVLGIPGVTVYDDFFGVGRHAPAVVLNIGNYGSGEISGELTANYGIYTRTGVHCAPLMHWTLGTVDQGAVRFSVSYYSTEEEVDQAVQAVRELVA